MMIDNKQCLEKIAYGDIPQMNSNVPIFTIN